MKGWVSVFLFIGLISCSHESTWEKRFKDKEAVYDEKVPELSSDDHFPSSLPRIEIQLNRDNSVQIGDKIYPDEKLQMAYNWAQDKNGGKAVIRFRVHVQSSYGTFSNVQAIIENYNKKVRHAQAIEQHDLHYDDLTPQQRKAIDQEYPIRMLEIKFGK